MRIWSINPKYLDTMGLVSAWREGLLAKKVLEGKTSGYRNHPQLNRFKEQKDSLLCINTYLYWLYEESLNRGYKFEKNKIGKFDKNLKINVNKKQIEFEFNHLQKKLKLRNPDQYNKNNDIKKIESNNLFNIINKNKLEDWEKGIFENKYIETYKIFKKD